MRLMGWIPSSLHLLTEPYSLAPHHRHSCLNGMTRFQELPKFATPVAEARVAPQICNSCGQLIYQGQQPRLAQFPRSTTVISGPHTALNNCCNRLQACASPRVPWWTTGSCAAPIACQCRWAPCSCQVPQVVRPSSVWLQDSASGQHWTQCNSWPLPHQEQLPGQLPQGRWLACCCVHTDYVLLGGI